MAIARPGELWRCCAAMLIGAVLVVGWSDAAHAQEIRTYPPRPLLTVTGEGETRSDPDRVFVRLGASIESDSATEAQARVNKIMQRVLQSMRQLEIPDQRIQTAELSLFPVFTADDPRAPHPQAPRVRGYRAANSVRVELEDLQRIGQVIDAGVEAGANSLDSIRFDLRDDTAARSEALKQAAANAQQKAKAIAAAMGLELGPIHEIVEQGTGFFPPEPRAARVAMAEMATPVQPGQLTITATVTISYQIGAQEGGDQDADD